MSQFKQFKKVFDIRGLTSKDLSILRGFLYAGQKEVMPKKIRWKTKLEPFVDEMALRIGLIPFSCEQDQVTVKLSNKTGEFKLIKASDLDNENLKALCPEAVVISLPPGEYQFEIVFEAGYGSAHAAYDLLYKKFGESQLTLIHPYKEIDRVMDEIYKECLQFANGWEYE